jgi:hypothetical protein
MGLEEEAKAWPTPFVTKLVLHRGVPLVERLRADGLLREKGTDVDYVFKDWQVRLMARVALLSSACSGFFRAARRLFGRRQSYRS